MSCSASTACRSSTSTNPTSRCTGARPTIRIAAPSSSTGLFGGYAIYREPLSLAPFERVPGAVRGLLGKVSRRLPDGMRGKDLLRRGALPLEQRYYGNARIFRDDQLAEVLRGYDPRCSHTDVTAVHYRDSAGWHPVSRMQHVDLMTWLRGDILVKADKMTMAHSLELRVPFLDPEVFTVASGLLVSEKLSHGTTSTPCDAPSPASSPRTC